MSRDWRRGEHQEWAMNAGLQPRKCRSCLKENLDNWGRCRTDGCKLELQYQFKPLAKTPTETEENLSKITRWKAPSKQQG